MKILCKYPTRERPAKCIERISEYLRLSDNPGNIKFLVSYDVNDPTMNNSDILAQLDRLGVNHIGGNSINKIHAVNRDMQHSGEWDIAILASDDMVCEKKGWDSILINEMREHFPDTDGCLFHWDGDRNTLRGNLCTMNIMGLKYYNRFGYFYHPTYRSLWCDNEFTEVAFQEGKMFFSKEILFAHHHYSNGKGEKDALMNRTQAFYHIDKATYDYRKSFNFGL